jgi:hypothetical protein
VLTDADGRFAFAAVSAGEWTLAVEKAPYTPTQHPRAGRTLRTSRRPLLVTDGAVVDNITIPMHTVSAIAGRVLDSHGDPVDYATVRVLRPGGPSGLHAVSSASPNEFGEFRAGRLAPGSYLLQAVPYDRGPERAADTQPLPTFFPSVPSVNQAQRLTIRRGESIADADIMLIEGTPHIVTGSVVDAQGHPVTTGHVNIRTVTPGFGGWTSGGSAIKPDGTFQLKVAPGEYVLEAQGVRNPDSTRAEDAYSGSVHASVTGGAIDVVIRVGPPATIAGTIVFDGTAPLPDPKQVQVHAAGTEGVMCRSGRAEVAADWTFRITGVVGTCFIESHTPAWRQRAVVVGREDFAGRTVTLEAGQSLQGVKVILSDRRSGLTLRVDDEQGRRTREYVAIVFSTDRERWKNGWTYLRTYVPPSTAFVGGAGPGSRGQPGAAPPPAAPQEIVEMLPGEYFVVAIDDIEREDARNPGVLEKLTAHATRVTIVDGAHIDVALRRLEKH